MNKHLKHVLCLGLVGLNGSAYALSPPQITGQWVKTWGAIAPANNNIFGTAVGEDSKYEAERVALADCKARGGEACKIEQAYQNQCVAMVVGKKEFKIHSAESISAATTQAMTDCQQHDTTCRVTYSVCSVERFVED